MNTKRAKFIVAIFSIALSASLAPIFSANAACVKSDVNNKVDNFDVLFVRGQFGCSVGQLADVLSGLRLLLNSKIK